MYVPKDKWWIAIAVAAGVFPLSIVFGLILGVSGVVFGEAIRNGLASILFLGLGVLWLISPIAVYYDRKYVMENSDWVPGRIYYATILGYLGMFLAILYTWKRHKYVGIP